MPRNDQAAFLEMTKAMHNLSSGAQDAYRSFWSTLDLSDYESAREASIVFTEALLRECATISQLVADEYVDGRENGAS